MKKLFAILFTVMLSAAVYAQAPQKMSCQAVVRNQNNVLVINTLVGMRISILQGSAAGVAVYVETQKPTTNANGLASFSIGSGTLVSGNFATINWANGSYFIKTETDPNGGGNYSIAGTSQLMSVPYALFAASGNPGPQGLTGATGATGAAGPQGIVGATGAAGTNGTIGATGPQGSIGLTGATGAQGPTGLTGATGAAGTNGTIGATGPQGPNGLTGATGAVGAIGPIGLTGPAGAQGANGVAGSAGVAGPMGATGIPGQTVLIKTTAEPAGVNCMAGGVLQEYGIDANNNGVLEASEINASLSKYICNGNGGSGSVGPAGPAGPQGVAGATGPQGTVGLTGATGPQGPAGASTGRIVSVNTLNDFCPTVPGGSTLYVFAGPTATITTTATQRIIVTGSIVLGRASNIPANSVAFIIGAGYQPLAGGVINNMASVWFTQINVTDIRTAQAIAGSIVPGAGTWKIGAVIKNQSPVALNANDYMNLVIMVVEQ